MALAAGFCEAAAVSNSRFHTNRGQGKWETYGPPSPEGAPTGERVGTEGSPGAIQASRPAVPAWTGSPASL